MKDTYDTAVKSNIRYSNIGQRNNIEKYIGQTNALPKPGKIWF